MTTICTATAIPLPRSPTPRPTFQIVTKKTSVPKLRSPIGHRKPEIDPGSMDSPAWEHQFNLISPSTASHGSPFFPSGEFESPRVPPLITTGLAINSGMLSAHSRASSASEMNMLTSPSAPVQLPGDELLYDISTEPRPDERLFDLSFQAALNKTRKEMKDLSLAIWGCTAAHQVGSDLYALRQWAQELSEFEPSRTRTVGLIGDSGVGKSSLINSLLDQPDLACSRSDIRSCTSVVTEYRFRLAHHNEPFGMEVDYMTAEEVKELIEELLRTFRQYYIPSYQEVETSEERKAIRARSEKAWNTLHSMFRNQPLLTKKFLLDYPDNAETPLVSVLHHWAAVFLADRPGGPKAHTWSATSFDIDECTDRMDAFLRDPLDEHTPALWPFIRVVRIYLRSPVLQSGLVLVDCPSLRDLNHARLCAVERYVRNCSEIFAVTTMDRALTDQGVVDIVRRNGRHRPLRIICTGSENVTPREVERNSPDISLQVRNWRQQIEDLSKEVKRCEARRRHGIVGALQDEVQSRDALQQLEFGLNKFLIERRNYHIATQLIDLYADEVQLGDLKVFCVSNKQYFEHRHDEQSWAEPRLELSGIVNLRKYCHSIPAEAQFSAAAAFIEHDAPAFVRSLHQWALGGTDEISKEKAQEIQMLVKHLEEVSIMKLVLPTSQLQTARTDLNRDFTSNIVTPIREHRTEWKEAAVQISQEWAKWHVDDYAAFCRHHGIHETQATGARNWNEELIAPMRQQLQSSWGFFLEGVEDNKTELINHIYDVFNSIRAQLEEHCTAAPQAIQNLLANIPFRRDAIIHIITTGFEDFLEGTSQIESDTLYGHSTSYTAALMAPAYHACATEHGPLAPNRRKQIITTHLLTTRLFPKLSTMIERHHRMFVRAAFDAMIGQITKEVDGFVRDLHLLVGEGDLVAEVSTLTLRSKDEEVDDGLSEEEREKKRLETRFEARRFADFARRMRERLVLAERALGEAKEVVVEMRGR